GPGIGKIDVDNRKAALGDVLGKEESRLGANGSHIGAPGAANPIAGVSPEPPRPFDAEEIHLRPRSGLVEEKSSFADSDFQLNGMIVSEQLAPADGARQRIRFQSNRFGNHLAMRLHAIRFYRLTFPFNHGGNNRTG